MTRVFLIAAASLFSISAATACNYQKSVRAETDETKVASAAQMSQPVTDATTVDENGNVIVKEKAAE
jgi:hypothetical protein